MSEGHCFRGKHSAWHHTPECLARNLGGIDHDYDNPSDAREHLNQGMLGDLIGPEFRLRWWQELEVGQPEVAAYLVRKFPSRYPLTEANVHA
jgi:hypothetical protein